MKLTNLWRRACIGACAFHLIAAASAAAQPLTLEEALRRAEEQSPLATAGRARIAAAEARARQAGVLPNPELDVEVEDAIGTGRFSDLSQTELTVSLQQRFERGGKRAARRSVAEAELGLAQLQLLRIQTDLRRDVQLGFADAVAAEELVALARAATVRAEELARTVRLLVEVGRDPPLRQFRAEAELATAGAAEQEAMANFTRAQRALAVLTGADEATLTIVASADVPQVVGDGSGAPLAVRIAEAERRVAEAQVGIATSSGVQDVTVRGGIRGFVDTGDVALVAGVTLPLAIRDTNRGGIEAARAEALAAEAQLAQARLDAGREFRDGQALLDAANARLAALEGAGLVQAREAVRVARIGYSAGRFSLVEVLDAETALNTTLRSIVEARRDRARGLAALQRARAQ